MSDMHIETAVIAGEGSPKHLFGELILVDHLACVAA